jgi:hypothetical protein
MPHIGFLIEQVFKDNTKEGSVPTTDQEFAELYSNKEYGRVLRELLIGLNIIRED